MSRSHIPAAVRSAGAEQARYRCGYCLTAESVVGVAMDAHHIIPEAVGGVSEESNLWQACSACNAHKGNRASGRDQVTGEVVPFFDPRRQTWAEHFAWSDDRTEVVGKTPCGRVTVLALQLNRRLIVAARARWVAAGWHPPRD